jgi:hypothetical protein
MAEGVTRAMVRMLERLLSASETAPRAGQAEPYEISAWCRTAQALARKGLVRIVPDEYRAVITEAGREFLRRWRPYLIRGR